MATKVVVTSEGLLLIIEDLTRSIDWLDDGFKLTVRQNCYNDDLYDVTLTRIQYRFLVDRIDRSSIADRYGSNNE